MIPHCTANPCSLRDDTPCTPRSTTTHCTCTCMRCTAVLHGHASHWTTLPGSARFHPLGSTGITTNHPI